MLGYPDCIKVSLVYDIWMRRLTMIKAKQLLIYDEKGLLIMTN